MATQAQWNHNPIIRQIVNRCHVGESNSAVLRYVVSRMKSGAWRAQSRAERKRIMRAALKMHAENRALFSHFRF